MKNVIILAGLLMMGSASAQTATVKCFGKIDGKTESFNARVQSGKLIFWSKKKMVDASKTSAFAWLADMDNFGLEGSGYYSGNGYMIMSATNTAEKIEIGVSRDLTKGFYRYRDGGSGLGHSQAALKCYSYVLKPGV